MNFEVCMIKGSLVTNLDKSMVMGEESLLSQIIMDGEPFNRYLSLNS